MTKLAVKMPTKKQIKVIEERVVKTRRRQRPKPAQLMRRLPTLNSKMENMSISRAITMPVSAGLVYGKSTPIVRSAGSATFVENVEVNAGFSVSTTFAPSVIQCMPSTIGPWLSGVAANWSKYRWRKLRWIYVPTCPTTTLGSIHIGLQYDNVDATPTSVAQMSALQSYTTGPAWSGYQAAALLSKPNAPCPPGSLVVDVDVARFEKPWYSYISQTQFATQNAVAISLANLFSPARLIFATTDGTATAVSCGRLYAQYMVELIEPEAAASNL